MLRTLFAISALLVAACTSSPGSTPAHTAAPAATPAAASQVAAGQTVSLATGHFVGPNGMSLYTFDKDTTGTTNCYDKCADNWPALTVTSAGAITVGTGLNTADFGTVTRTDGGLQVAFKQIPLYYFAGDSAVGDINGDGVSGVWHLATTSATLPPPAASAPASAGPSAAPPACNPDDPYCEPSTPAAGGSPAPSAGAAVQIDKSAAGRLVNALGLSLYTNDNDSAETATCTGSCADNWPALTVANEDELPAESAGVTGTLAVIDRADGLYQVTYNGKPLYLFVGDSAAGQTNGDGLLGVWHLANP